MAWSSGYKGNDLPPPGYRPWHRRYYYDDPFYYLMTWLCALLVFLVVLLGLAALITFLVLNPHKPSYTIEDVQISQLSVASSSSNPNQNTLGYPYEEQVLDADILVSVQVYNRNHHMGIYNTRMVAVLYHEDEEIAKFFFPSFYQRPRDVTFLQSTISVRGYPLRPSVATSLTAAAARKAIPLHSLIASRVKYKIGSWKPAWHRWFYTGCDLVVGTSASLAGAHILYKNC